MRNSLLTLLISFASTNILGDISHFKCEAKEGFLFERQGYTEKKIYKKGEKFEFLTINRETNLVIWATATYDFEEDLNKDFIYEFYDGVPTIYSTKISFNSVSGMLREITVLKPKNVNTTTLDTEYECKKTTPIFD
tara:strand:- start:61 stop:468 length:408 start_codon:yes stop_codon:yes gene_type:complete